MKKRLVLWGYLLILGWLLLFGRRPGVPGRGSVIPLPGSISGVPLFSERGLSAGSHPVAGTGGECAAISAPGHPAGPGKFLEGADGADAPDGGAA